MLHRLYFQKILHLLYIFCKYFPKCVIILDIFLINIYEIKFNILFQMWYGQRENMGEKKQ